MDVFLSDGDWRQFLSKSKIGKVVVWWSESDNVRALHEYYIILHSSQCGIFQDFERLRDINWCF
jgi:hypothetical protein